MTKDANIWFPQYINEFLADVFDYTAEEIGILQILKVHYWKRADKNGGYLPNMSDADLAAITRLPIDRVQIASKVLQKTYVFDGEIWRNSSEDLKIKRALKRRKTARENARISVTNRKLGKNVVSKTEAKEETKDEQNTEQIGQPNLGSHSHIHSHRNSLSNNSLSLSLTDTEENVSKSSSSDSEKKYAFQGRVIKITHKDFKNLEQNYKHIPDLRGELASLDVFYSGEKPIPEKWFMRMSQALNNKNQKYAEGKKSQQQEQEKHKNSRQPDDVAKEWGYA